jgi:hypothetical protein
MVIGLPDREARLETLDRFGGANLALLVKAKNPLPDATDCSFDALGFTHDAPLVLSRPAFVNKCFWTERD